MRKFGFLILSLFIINSVSAQDTEYSLHLNSGLFSFGGESATKRSIIIVSDVSTIDNYTNNPYGKEKALSYGLAGQIKRVTKSKLVIGVQAGYEILRSRVHIDGIAGEFMVTPEPPNGNTVLTHGFITLYSHIGKRFIFDDIEADLAVGPEFGFNTFSRENGKVNFGNGTVETNTERNNAGTDIRFRPELTITYHNWGVTTGYSLGFHNYSKDLTGPGRERFSRFLRFGITYRLK